MPFVLRVTQRYVLEQRKAFMDLEAKFIAMEQRRRTEFPKGRRSQPFAGSLPTNTLIWECEFPSLAQIQAFLEMISTDPEHDALFRQQVPYMLEAHTEIQEILNI